MAQVCNQNMRYVTGDHIYIYIEETDVNPALR